MNTTKGILMQEAQAKEKVATTIETFGKFVATWKGA
jgi:hypothetical protein